MSQSGSTALLFAVGVTEISVHKMFAEIKRINVLKCGVNKIYILVLDKTNGILYHVARKSSPSEDFYFYCVAK